MTSGPGGTSPSTRCTSATWCRREGDGNPPGGDGARCDPHGQVLGDDAGRSYGAGMNTSCARAIRSTSRTRWAAGDPGFNQAVFNNARAGSDASEQRCLEGASIQRRRSGLTFRIGPKSGQIPIQTTQFPVDCPGRTLEAGRTRRQLWRPHTPTRRSRHCRICGPVEWGRADGTLAVRLVSAGGGAAQIPP